MKNLLLLMMLASTIVQAQWQPVKGKIMTPWAGKINVQNVLPEYPRPQMMRSGDWKNLNGLWDYAIRKAEESCPAAFDGKILVPFAVESALSGVGKLVGKTNNLWYRTTFALAKTGKGKRVMLHFGGVDWQTEIFVNGKSGGVHEGGNDPFSFDITALCGKTAQQELVVRVWDPTDEGTQPRGKQVRKPEGIWYTPVTGIWQTVWLEFVPETHIMFSRHTPDIDKQVLSVTPHVANLQNGDAIIVTAFDGNAKVSEEKVENNREGLLPVSRPKLWSPSNPFLYDLKIRVERKGKVIDEVKSYFAMRKISMTPDADGNQRMLLNDQFCFQYGPLDQGWWPDGLYTAPSDEAMKYDIERLQAMGFNMIRKHIKVEPARYYYYCDKMGMLMWQDMPSGDLGGNAWESHPGVFSITSGKDKIRSEQSEACYRKEWNSIMDALHNFPSIVVWIPFNEGWGQFKTVEITNWTMQKDPSRLVNSASGGSFFPVGHIFDVHHYPEPLMPAPALFGAKQVLVLGEYGGLGLSVDGHTWQVKDNWGYQSFKNADELFTKYSTFISETAQLIGHGLSAAVYTQTTDVEIETNGLITYDRKVIKVSEEKLKQVHQQLYEAAKSVRLK